MFVDTTSLMYHNEKDRVNPKDWFKRKERGGTTMQMAVKLGYREFELKHNLIKRLFYSLTLITEPLLKMTLFFTSPFKALDFLSFKIYKLRIGISTYKGYVKKY